MRKFIDELEEVLDEIYDDAVQESIIEKCDEGFDIIEKMKEKDIEDSWPMPDEMLIGDRKEMGG